MLLSDAKRELQELKASWRKTQKEKEELEEQARIPHPTTSVTSAPLLCLSSGTEQETSLCSDSWEISGN